MTKNEMWIKLTDDGIATEEECQLVTDILGFTEEALLQILEARTGYRSFEQLEEDEYE